MPTFILKPTREDDFFIAYSTITDSVYCWGTREEIEAIPNPALYLGSDRCIPERLDRAESNGTSDMVGLYPFDSGQLLVRWDAEGEQEIGAHLIDRADIRRWLENNDDSLLRPVVYDDEGYEVEA